MKQTFKNKQGNRTVDVNIDETKVNKLAFDYKTKNKEILDYLLGTKGSKRNMGRKIAAGVCFYNDKLSLRRCLESLQKDNVDLVFCVDGRFKQFGEKGKYPDLSDDGSRELVLTYDNTILIDMPDSWETQKRQAYLKACHDFDIDYLLIIDSDEYILYDPYDPNQGTNWDKFIEKMIQTCESITYKQHNVFGIDVETGNKNYVDTVKTLMKESKHRGPNPAQPAADNNNNSNDKDQQSQQQTSVPNPQIPFRRRQFMNLPRLWHRPSEMVYNGKHYAFHPRDVNNPYHKIESVAAAWIIPFLYFGHDHVYKQINTTLQRDRLLYQKFLIDFEQNIVNYLFNTGRFHIDPDDMDKVSGWHQEALEFREFERKQIENFNDLRQKAKESNRLKYIQEQQKKHEVNMDPPVS